METIPIELLTPDPDNANQGTPDGAELLADAIRGDGLGRSIFVDQNGVIVGGNKTWEAARAAGVRTVRVIETDGTELIAVKRGNVGINTAQGRRMALADNGLGRLNFNPDLEAIARQAAEYGIDLDQTGLDAETLAAFQAAALDAAEETDNEAGAESNHTVSATDITRPQTLSDPFGAPAADVFDTRQAEWKARKRQWMTWGIKPEGDATPDTIYDPVFCEVLYRWYMSPPQRVLDPFGGESVRGLVAHRCGMEYVGIDHRQTRVNANRGRAETLIESDHPISAPVWMEGYAQELLRAPDLFGEADLIHASPPPPLLYASADPRDLSGMTWDQYSTTLDEIIRLSLAILRPNRFSIWLVDDLRDGDGRCRNFPAQVIGTHERHGATLYQDAILITPPPPLAVQAFRRLRVLGKCHRRALIFYKGETRRIREFFPAEIPIAPDADTSTSAGDASGDPETP